MLTAMTPEQKFAFESIVGFVHRTATEVAGLPKETRAAALEIVRQSMAVEFGTADPQLIEICAEGIATVLRQIEAAGSPSGERP